MKRAILLPQYSDVKPFVAPEGITTARIDKTSNLLADSTCPSNILYAAFLDGTAPVNTCSQMSENPQNFIQKILGIGGSKTVPRRNVNHTRTNRPRRPKHPTRRQRPRQHAATRPTKEEELPAKNLRRRQR